MRFRPNVLTGFYSSLSLLALAVFHCPTSAQAQGIWTGGVDSDWSTGGNWDDGNVPNATVDVLINGAGVPPYVVDPAGAYAKRVTVGDSVGAGTLDIQSLGFLQIADDLVISDPNGANPGSVTLTGAGAFLNVKGALTINDSGNGISKLTIDGGTTVAVNGTTTIGDDTVLQFTGASGGTLLGSGGVAIDGTLLFDQSAGGITVGKDLFGAGIVKVSSGTGTVVLSGDNSAFTGIFNVSGGGGTRCGECQCAWRSARHRDAEPFRWSPVIARHYPVFPVDRQRRGGRPYQIRFGVADPHRGK